MAGITSRAGGIVHLEAVRPENSLSSGSCHHNELQALVEPGDSVRRACDVRGNWGLERATFVYRSQGQRRSGEEVDVGVRCE